MPKKSFYLTDGRLADILALLQALGLDSLVYRSEAGADEHEQVGGLSHELKSKPQSAESWTEVAEQHPEFFRVDHSKAHPVSLICRHIHETSPTLRKQPFDTAIVIRLMDLAVELHDREIKRSQSWSLYVPLWVAAISGAFLMLRSLVVNL